MPTIKLDPIIEISVTDKPSSCDSTHLAAFVESGKEIIEFNYGEKGPITWKLDKAARDAGWELDYSFDDAKGRPIVILCVEGSGAPDEEFKNDKQDKWGKAKFSIYNNHKVKQSLFKYSIRLINSNDGKTALVDPAIRNTAFNFMKAEKKFAVFLKRKIASRMRRNK